MSPELIAITLLGFMLAVEIVATVLGLWGIARVLERISDSIGDLRREIAVGRIGPRA